MEYSGNRAEDALPVVVVLGDFAHEGLTAKIESLGFAVVNKRFRSSPRNWHKIIDLLHGLNEEGRLALVFGYLPTPTVLFVADGEYDEVRVELVSELERVDTTFFVYEDNLEGLVEPLPWEIYDVDEDDLANEDLPWSTTDLPWGKPDRAQWLDSNRELIERAMQIVTDWTASGIAVLPFRKRSDVTIRMFEALEDAQAGIFLRLYVPHGRYQSEQFEDFLTLFTRYLREVESKEFSVDVQRTSRGTTYVFKGRGEVGSMDDLRAATARFDDFLMLAQSDPSAAEALLVAAGSAAADAGFVVAKYARSFRRLQLETRHEFERRSLQLNQALEAEVLELAEPVTLPLPLEHQASSLFAVIGNSGPVTVNVAPGAMSVASTISLQDVLAGGTEYTQEDRVILDLIAGVHDELEALQLRSDLDRLKDSGTPPEERRTGAQKLKAFLYAAARGTGKRIEEVGTQVLIAYLNSLITGGSGQ